MASIGALALFLFSYLMLVNLSNSSVPSFEKVKVGLYYETLSISCSLFMVEELPKIFDNGLYQIADVHLVPYGNAKLLPNLTVICENGELECRLNTVHACAIHTSLDLKQHFPFILCIETLVRSGRGREWESCFDITDLDRKAVMDCLDGDLWKQLTRKAQYETPPHSLLPWVTVDGKPLGKNYPAFMWYICNAYKGIPLPDYCSQLAEVVPTEKEQETKQVRNVEKPTEPSI